MNRRIQINKKLIFSSTLLVLGVIFYDKYNGLIPYDFVNGGSDIDGMINTLFQVQASIATLGIALIALLSEAAKTTVFGVSVSRYVMQESHKILKHRTLIFTELCLIMMSYFAIVLKYNNLFISVFIISLVIILFMVNDIFILFYGSDYIKDDIKEYCLSIYEEDDIDKKNAILNSLEKDINFSVENNDFTRLKDDTELLFNILKVLIKEKDILTIRGQFQEVCTNLCEKIFMQEKSNQIYLCLNFIYEIYKECNEHNNDDNQYIFFTFLDDIYRELINSLRKIKYEIISSKYIIEKIHKELYKNLYFEKEKAESSYYLKNNYFLKMYSSFIYHEFFILNKQNNSEENISKVKHYLYENLKNIIEYDTYKYFQEEKKEMAYDEICNYFKILIDNFDEDALEDIFFDSFLDIYSFKEYRIRGIFIIVIYLYYLLEKESLVDDDLREFVKKLMKKKSFTIGNFIFRRNRNYLFNEKLINTIKNKLRTWEKYPKKRGMGKVLIMEDTINEFLIFTMLKRNSYKESLMQDILLLVHGNEFHFYTAFVGNNKMNTVEKYEKFLTLFDFEAIEKHKLIQKVDMLESAISDIYKTSEIKVSEKEKLNDEDIETLKENIQEKCSDTIKECISIFNKIPADIKTKTKTMTLFNLDTDTRFIFEDVNSRMGSWIKQSLIILLIQLINENLLAINKNYDDKESLEDFFHSIEENELTVDTLIGYRNWFYGYIKEDRFAEFEKNKNKIESDGLGNIVVAINSKQLFFMLKKIKVYIKNYSETEILSDKKRDANTGDGYMYNITNDIFIGFKKEELIEYVNNRKKKITVEIEFEYGISGKPIGLGLFFKND
ncbi:hypothetical protein [Clostridium beijerinckii]|uniref:Uncharacterized protein n=1 Tax=Clostridium beijerinckii TaxID=1520 RepID=A0A1S9NB80_CLOBE|nr:hypothetical protein [Clostridium beijerinckii]OOP74671.1 hypothetical protein CBEIBR21_00450 [Clostridium beijerinckii]